MNPTQRFVFNFIVATIILVLVFPPYVRWLDSFDPAPLGIKCKCCTKQ